ncbi:MAG: right-handed parallel beta-helix repeat-containing protein [Myxococcaceae bacterium]|nr:right-handed parallel beta-helix repeat-containing protein [Myxococcaceae bacterium]
MNRLVTMTGVTVVMLACPSPVEPPGCDGGGCVTTDAGAMDCSAGSFRNAAGQCQPAGWTSCGDGFTADPTGWTCRAVVETCDAGAFSFPGRGCEEIGWRACPIGFDARGASCEPVLPAAPCPGATRAALGSAACVPVGDCTLAFPPSAATFFVDASGPVDATHFRTLGAALAAAPNDATVAVSPGRYVESLAPTKPVKLIGRCAAQVTLVAADQNPALTLVNGVRVELEGVTISGSILAARLESGASLTARHVVLDGNERSGVQAVDRTTRVVLDDVVVRGTRPDPATGTFGQGVAIGTGATAQLTDVELRGNGETGLFVNQAGAQVTLTRVVIADTKVRASTGRLGWGVAVQSGGALTATQVVIDESRGVGLLVAQGGSSATLSDVFIRNVASSTDNSGERFGFGASAQQGSLTWRGGGVEDVQGGLIDVQGGAGVATLERLTLRRTRPGPAPRFGVDVRTFATASLTNVLLEDVASSGVLALERTTVNLDRVAVDGVEGVGVRAQGGRVNGTAVAVRGHTGAGALASFQGSVTLEKCSLGHARGVGGDAGSNELGLGASASQDGGLSLDACVLEDNVTAGVYVRDPGSTALITRTEVSGTRLDGNGEFGQGLIVEKGAKVTVEDSSFLENHTAGLQVADPRSALTAARVTVLGTRPLASGQRGRGANVAFDARATLVSSAFVDNQQVGLFAFQARLDVSDTVVTGTRSDPDGRYGNGLEALTAALIVFTRGAVSRSAGIAAVFAEGAGVLDGARLANNPVAIHAQDGSTLLEVQSAPAQPGPRDVVVTSATVFEANQAKTSSETLSVPPP